MGTCADCFKKSAVCLTSRQTAKDKRRTDVQYAEKLRTIAREYRSKPETKKRRNENRRQKLKEDPRAKLDHAMSRSILGFSEKWWT
jgi:hypothetical protein